MATQPIERAEIERPRRWHVPFGPDMTPADVDRVLSVPTFARIDADAFPPSTPLRGIIQNDTRIVRYRGGDIVVRQGDYGNSAFFVLEGTVRVVLDGLPASLLGRKGTARKSWFDAVAQLWRNPRLPEVRDPLAEPSEAQLGTREAQDRTTRIFLRDVAEVVRQHTTVPKAPGEFFGELAALGRSPRTATVVAEGDAELLEIRWQGLRDIQRRCDEIRKHIDELYRDHALDVELRESPLLRHLDDVALGEVADHTVFETYGSVDWHVEFKQLSMDEEAGRFAGEPVLAEEGHYANGLILVRAGFVRVSQRIGAGERTDGYLRRGDAYGLDELSDSWRDHVSATLRHTLRALGYVDILRIPTPVVEKHVLPALAGGPLAPQVGERGLQPVGATSGQSVELDSALLEFLGEQRFINGTSMMVVDLERCVRCDDCVCACAAAHDGNPRFLRHGPRFGRYLIPNACMHCVDPVCMIGCPTGAIHRSEEEGQVVINDFTCIGCATCADSCPYHNIRVVEIRNPNGELILDKDTHLPVLKATKCDLCVDQLGGPACRRACPHDALERVDMRDLASLAEWTRR